MFDIASALFGAMGAILVTSSVQFGYRLVATNSRVAPFPSRLLPVSVNNGATESDEEGFCGQKRKSPSPSRPSSSSSRSSDVGDNDTSSDESEDSRDPKRRKSTSPLSDHSPSRRNRAIHRTSSTPTLRHTPATLRRRTPPARHTPSPTPTMSSQFSSPSHSPTTVQPQLQDLHFAPFPSSSILGVPQESIGASSQRSSLSPLANATTPLHEVPYTRASSLEDVRSDEATVNSLLRSPTLSDISSTTDVSMYVSGIASDTVQCRAGSRGSSPSPAAEDRRNPGGVKRTVKTAKKPLKYAEPYTIGTARRTSHTRRRRSPTPEPEFVQGSSSSSCNQPHRTPSPWMIDPGCPSSPIYRPTSPPTGHIPFFDLDYPQPARLQHPSPVFPPFNTHVLNLEHHSAQPVRSRSSSPFIEGELQYPEDEYFEGDDGDGSSEDWEKQEYESKHPPDGDAHICFGTDDFLRHDRLAQFLSTNVASGYTTAAHRHGQTHEAAPHLPTESMVWPSETVAVNGPSQSFQERASVTAFNSAPRVEEHGNRFRYGVGNESDVAVEGMEDMTVDKDWWELYGGRGSTYDVPLGYQFPLGSDRRQNRHSIY